MGWLETVLLLSVPGWLVVEGALLEATAGGDRLARPPARRSVPGPAGSDLYDGVHYRFSTEGGSAMGRKIGQLATRNIPRAVR